eukprot:scaffold14958_cov79-Phaeocystis_antarctica.AAC.12
MQKSGPSCPGARQATSPGDSPRRGRERSHRASPPRGRGARGRGRRCPQPRWLSWRDLPSVAAEREMEAEAEVAQRRGAATVE